MRCLRRDSLKKVEGTGVDFSKKAGFLLDTVELLPSKLSDSLYEFPVWVKVEGTDMKPYWVKSFPLFIKIFCTTC